jgi:hypothetical protein
LKRVRGWSYQGGDGSGARRLTHAIVF